MNSSLSFLCSSSNDDNDNKKCHAQRRKKSLNWAIYLYNNKIISLLVLLLLLLFKSCEIEFFIKPKKQQQKKSTDNIWFLNACLSAHSRIAFIRVNGISLMLIYVLQLFMLFFMCLLLCLYVIWVWIHVIDFLIGNFTACAHTHCVPSRFFSLRLEFTKRKMRAEKYKYTTSTIDVFQYTSLKIADNWCYR